MAGAGFAVTKGARRITQIGGRLPRADKSLANRKNRRQVRQEVQARGVEADVVMKLWTERDVL
jgi:hypothetical protein